MHIKVLLTILLVSTALTSNHHKIEDFSPYDADDEREEVKRSRKIHIVLPSPRKTQERGEDELIQLHFATKLHILACGVTTGKVKKRKRDSTS
ncbi:hypothetical protein HOM50_01460 [bacterium]|nr:hypothetical protein [bacterium]MBT5015058.1 hypothetical protein [bacterium]